MTATLEDILADVADRITGVTGLGTVHSVEPDSITPPCAIVGLPSGDFIAYDPSMHSESCDYMLTVTLYVPASDMPGGQRLLFPLLRPSGATSVRAALAGYSQALGVSYAVGQATNIRQAKPEDATRYLACDITVKVMA